MNEILKRKMQMVLEKHKDGLYVDDFSEAFEELHGEALDLEEIGYNNIMEIVHQFDDIFRLVHPNNLNEKEKIFDAKQPLSVIQEMNKKLEIPKDLINIINQILQIHPNGISLYRLEQLFKLNCQSELPYTSLGFSSIESFVFKLMSFIPFVLLEEKGTKIICLTHNDKTNSNADFILAPPEPSVSLSIKSQGLKIPADAVIDEEEFLSQTIDERQDLNKYFKIVISDITNPSFFWFQIEGIHTTEALDILMNQLVSYNLPHGQDYVIPHNYFMLNMPCVGLYCEDWHRATMIGFPSNELVDLFYVDYGTIWTVKREEVRLIKKKFMSFPTQAIKARLALLEPASNADVWNAKAGPRLLELTKDKSLLCKVLSLDYKKGLSIQLCEERNLEDNLCINDILIDDGIAKKSEEETFKLRRSIHCGTSCHKQIEKSNYNSHSNPEGVTPQYYLAELEQTEFKKHFKAPPGLTQNPILQKLAAKALKNQNYDSLDSRSPTPPSVNASAQFDNLLLSRIPFRGSPTSILQTATVAPNPIYKSSKRVETTNPKVLRNTSTTPEKVSTPAAILSPVSPAPSSHKLPLQTSESSDYSIERASDNLTAPSQVRYTKFVKFSKMYDGYIINYYSRLYLATSDISYYIYGADVLVRLFKKLKLDTDIEMKFIEEKHCPALFNELRKNQVRGFTKLDMEKASVILLPLESCIKALQKIPLAQQELEQSIQKVLDNFDPQDPYWKETSEADPIQTDEFILKQLEKLETERRAVTKRLSEQDVLDPDTHIAYTQIMKEYIYHFNLSSTNKMIEWPKTAFNEYSLKTNNSDISDFSVASEPKPGAQKSVHAVVPIVTNQTRIQARSTDSNNAYIIPRFMTTPPNPRYSFSNIPQTGMVFSNIQYMQQYLMEQQPTPLSLYSPPFIFGANNAPFNNIYNPMNNNQ